MTDSQPGPGSAKPAGLRIGRYEILGRLGSGGMGEVYRARDLSLGRDVALKILPEAYSSDSERTRRFEREARSASGLNHPNIVTLHEVGSQDSIFYIAMELVEGKTLREVIRSGPIPLRKLLDIAVGVANGLARAHQAGVVHRDLKPENVMLSKDGFPKLLDFGLAKWLPFEGEAPGEETTLTATEPGTVLGTVGYMSPEQAIGKKVDFRSDQFSLGSILYEMACGKRAFQKETKPETLSAIIRVQPEPIASLNPAVPPPLRWIVERCLSKEPRDRYASTEDLARDLATVRDHLSESATVISGKSVVALAPRTRWGRWAAVILIPVFLFALGALAGSSLGKSPRPHFRRLTFRHDGICGARFAPDGQTVLYSAQREGRPLEIYSLPLAGQESRTLGLSNSQLLSISATGEMALLVGLRLSFLPPHTDTTVRDPRLGYATLARVPLGGGAPREILREVRWASFAPDGERLAVAHYVGGFDQLEFPIGKVLHRSASWINSVRVSPKGDAVAFKDGTRALWMDASGRTRELGNMVHEVLWSSDGDEVWGNRIRHGSTEIRAFRPKVGDERLLLALPGDFVLHDLSADGKLLVASLAESSEVFGIFPGDDRPRNLSWLDRSSAVDLSADGSAVLFEEIGAAGRSEGEELSMIYLRKTDGSPAVRLGPGNGMALSRDGKWVLSLTGPGGRDSQLALVPTSAGERKVLSTGRVQQRGRGAFFPDDRSIFFMGREQRAGPRGYVMDLAGSPPRPVTAVGVRRGLLSGDGRFVSGRAGDGDYYLYPTAAGGEARKVVGLDPREEPVQWSADGRFLYVRAADEISASTSGMVTKIYRLDPWSGRREILKEIVSSTSDRGGGIGSILISADGISMVYTHHSYASDLFLVEGLQ